MQKSQSEARTIPARITYDLSKKEIEEAIYKYVGDLTPFDQLTIHGNGEFGATLWLLPNQRKGLAETI